MSRLPIRHAIPLFLLGGLLAGPAFGQEGAVDVEALGLSEQTLRLAQMRRGSVFQQLINQAFGIAPDGIVTKEAVELSGKFQSTQHAARISAQYLGFDLDRDGRITFEELDGIMPVLDRQQRILATTMRAGGDRNGDGAVDLAEIFALAEDAAGGAAVQRVLPFADDLLAMDIDGDGRTTPDEIGRVARALEAMPEPPSGTNAGARAQTTTPGRACELPEPSEAAEIIIVSGYEGAALSNIAVAGRDVETLAARLVIEPGDRPVYIIVAAYHAMIWQIEGDTDRVERIVVQPRGTRTGPGAGVTGLDRAKVSFVPADACFKPFHEAANGIKANWLKQAMARVLGRPADKVAADYTLGFVALPSGRDVTPAPAPKPAAKDAQGRPSFSVDMHSPELLMRRFHPAGLSEVDPKTVVAPEQVTRYEVLPQEAGLVQLLADGSLERPDESFGGRRSAFIIRKPIAHFPAGLNGAHGVTFILGKGVPMPEGDPGHSPVIEEETGRCLSRNTTLCRGFE